MRHEMANRRRLRDRSGNSNRYTVRIEFPVSHRKQKPGNHSNRYTKRLPLASSDVVPGCASPASRDATRGASPSAAVISSHSPLVTRSHLRNGFRQGTASAVPKSRPNSGVSTPEGRGLICGSICETRSSHCSFRLSLTATNPPRKRFLIETPSRIEIPVSYRNKRTHPFLIETRSICCEHPDFSTREGGPLNKMRPFQRVNLRGKADERGVGSCNLYFVRRSRTLSLSTFPSTVFPSRRARAALITAPICFSESAPASAMASSMAWWTS
jgi:hypothetical protein